MHQAMSPVGRAQRLPGLIASSFSDPSTRHAPARHLPSEEDLVARPEDQGHDRDTNADGGQAMTDTPDVRLHATPLELGSQDVRLYGAEINFGNLAGLVGNWQGANGFNMIAVPNQKGDFELLVAPYTESLTVAAVQATTPNRGLIVIENIPTLQYTTTIVDSTTNGLMHVECGFWELAGFPERNNGFDIFRIASVPHGNAVEAMGVSSVTNGRPVIDPCLSGLPVGDLPDLNGYTDPYIFPSPGFSASTPNETLIKYLDDQEANGQTVTKTVTLHVSTRNKGGINNIASLRTNAKPTQFDATFWIETVEDASTGESFQQLQYSQRIMIEFPIQSDLSGQTIVWPHINVNTLTLTSEAALEVQPAG